MVKNYELSCGYKIGDLEDVIYLQPFENRIKYIIDKVDYPICEELIGKMYKIECNGVQLTEESSFDNRFAFNYTLTAKFDEGKSNTYFSVLDLLRKNKYRIVVKTKEGMYWLVNAEYPYQLNYDYEWSNSNHQCTLTFTSRNNIPTMKCFKLLNEIETLIPKSCGYFRPNISYFNIIEDGSVKITKNETSSEFTKITLIGDNVWKKVVPLKDSFNYHHNYSGDSFSDVIEFDVSLDDYLKAFHYNLIEFAKNTYTVKFVTANGNNIIVENLFPSFSLNTSESISSLNTIKITLRNYTNNAIKYNGSTPISDVDKTKKESGLKDDRNKHTEFEIEYMGHKYPAIECVSPTMAKRLLLPQVGKDGTETGYYYALEGYEQYFGLLDEKIIGTYDENTINNFDVSLYVYTERCKESMCLFTTTLNQNNYIINGSVFSFDITSSGGWKVVSKSPYLTLDKMEGAAGESSIVKVTSTGKYGEKFHITLKICDELYMYYITRLDSTTCFIDLDNVFEGDKKVEKNRDGYLFVNASSHTLTFNMTSKPINIEFESDIETDTIEINGNVLNVTIQPQKDRNELWHTIRVKSVNESGLITSFCDILIVQDRLWENWVVDRTKYECDGTTKYYLERYYTGLTYNNLVPTDEWRRSEDIYDRDSPDCTIGEMIKWVDTTDYICEDGTGGDYEIWSASTETKCYDDGNRYIIDVLMYSNDGENWSASTITRQGDLVGECKECERQYDWKASDTETKCDGVALYKVEYQRYSDDCGQTWETTEISRLGEKLSDNTVDCGGTGQSITSKTETIYRWEEDETTICVGGDLYHRTYKYESTDNGVTWRKTDIFNVGSFIKSNAEECNQDGDDYRWVIGDETMCDGTNLVKIEYQEHKVQDVWQRTGVIRPSTTIVEFNSAECNEDTEIQYKWVKSETETMCVGFSLYEVLEEYVSYDYGVNWKKTGIKKQGKLISLISIKCGDIKPIYRWTELASEIVCYNGDSYTTEFREVSYDNGLTWERTGESRRGNLIEEHSAQCEECKVEFRWENTEITACNGYNQTVLQQQYFSDDCWETKQIVEGATQIAILKENACECGYIPKKWVADEERFICNNYSKYQLLVEYEQLECDAEWTTTGAEKRGDIIEETSCECGFIESKWVVDSKNYICEVNDKYQLLLEYIKVTCDSDWVLSGNRKKGNIIEYNSDDCKEKTSIFERWVYVEDICGSELDPEIPIVPDEPDIDPEEKEGYIVWMEIGEMCSDDVPNDAEEITD